MTEFTEIIRKFNPYHDKNGRFCSADGASFMTITTKDPAKQHMADKAVERAKADFKESEKKRKAAETRAKNKLNIPKNAGKPVEWISQFSKCQTIDDVKAVLEKNMPGIVDIASKWSADYQQKGYADYNDKTTHGDLALYDIYQTRNYDQKPTLVRDSNLDAVAAKNGQGVFYRGHSNSRSTVKRGAEKAKEFLKGETYAGFGSYGNGTYAAKDLGDGWTGYNTANSYASGAKNSIVKFTMKKNTKWGNITDIYNEENVFYMALKSAENKVTGTTKEDTHLLRSVASITRDCGRYAALRGYDAYHTGDSDYVAEYTVILNHGKIIASNKRIS